MLYFPRTGKMEAILWNWTLKVESANSLKSVKPRLQAVDGTGLVLDFVSTGTRVIVR